MEVTKFRLQTSIPDANKTAAILSPCDVTSVTRLAKLLVNCIALELYSVFLALFWPEKNLLKQNLTIGILRQYILLMSSNESGGDPQSCESSSETA